MTEIRPTYGVGRRTNGGLSASVDARDFPGCHGVPMTEEEVARPDDGRHIEYWDARRGVAWMVRDVSAAHERPIHRLTALLERIAQARGAPIECYGTMTFCERGPQGDRIRSMEADQTVYLNTPRAQALRSPATSRHPMSCWKWTTRRMFDAGSSPNTKSGASRRFGWRCRRPAGKANRAVGGDGERPG